ncbi:MAG TPA: 50S ribosomal protein L24 [Candidatus Krumholzibacteriaceae bacterium]|nr:50S ribosomal protein L24 [Candidatus Krumholzibacteriaceae bacterium]
MKKGAKKPSTVRRNMYNAPNHKKRKYLSAPLSPSLRAEYGTRSMPVVANDTVNITKGDRKLAEGKVLRVDTKDRKIYIEGVTRTRQDGSTVQIPIRTENVMITRLHLDDEWRRNILERKSFSAEEE